MKTYSFQKFVPYRLNWQEIEKYPVAVVSEIMEGDVQEDVQNFGDIVADFYENRETVEIREDDSGWSLVTEDVLRRYGSQGGNNLGNLLLMVLKLVARDVPIEECLFFYVGRDKVINDAQIGHEFFVLHNGDVVEEAFMISECEGEELPETVFKAGTEHTWESDVDLEKQIVRLGYEKFYQNTNKGKLLARVARSKLETSSIDGDADEYGEALNMAQLRTLESIKGVSDKLKAITLILAIIAIEVLVLCVK